MRKAIQFRRFWRGVPPKSKGDYAFITHMIEIAKRQSGRVAVIVPHGVLFRGGAEGRIRRQLIEENLLDAVVGLPANLFTTTGIPVAILIFDRAREEGGANEDRTDVLFIDASKEFTPDKNRNVMDETHIGRVLETYRTRTEVDRYSHRANPSRLLRTATILTFPATSTLSSQKRRSMLPLCRRTSCRSMPNWSRSVRRCLGI